MIELGKSSLPGPMTIVLVLLKGKGGTGTSGTVGALITGDAEVKEMAAGIAAPGASVTGGVTQVRLGTRTLSLNSPFQ